VPNQRLVFADAYTSAWEPSAKPFMTVSLTFEDAGNGKTNYTARVRRWSIADREAHETMGFHKGGRFAPTSLRHLSRSSEAAEGFLAHRNAAIICRISTSNVDDGPAQHNDLAPR
jgi:hypothetical protein